MTLNKNNKEKNVVANWDAGKMNGNSIFQCLLLYNLKFMTL